MTETLVGELLKAIKEGMRNAIIERLRNYNTPLDEVIKTVVVAESSELKKLLTEAVSSAMKDQEWRDQIASAVRGKLAKVLIEKFGGEMERQVNFLKSDPVTRARITAAIDEVITTSGKK